MPQSDPADERIARLARLETQLARKEQELAEARAQAAASERDRIALEVAGEKGLPAAFAHRLRGATREELEEDASALLTQFPGLAKPAPALKPDPAQGQQAIPEPASGTAEGARLYASRHQKQGAK